MFKGNKVEKIQYIKVRKEKGQDLLRLISNKFKKTPLIDKKSKVVRENDFILFPIIENKILIEILVNLINNFDFELISKEKVPNTKYKFKNIEEFLKGEIPDEYFYLIPKSYDIIGEIAIIEFSKYNSKEDKEIQSYKISIAKAIASINSKVRTVYEKISEIKGEFRLRDFNLLYGPNESETIYKENNCVFKLDIKSTFFTPRLIAERKRIAAYDIKKSETIADLFAGVGPFSVQIAKKHDIEIYAFDINPEAIKYMLENIKLNSLKGSIIPCNIDIKCLLEPLNQLGNALKNKIDRIIMNFPERSLEFLDVACFLMKNAGGILHIYQFCEKPNPIKNAISNLKREISNLNWSLDTIIESKIVKSYSPKSDLVVLDSIIRLN